MSGSTKLLWIYNLAITSVVALLLFENFNNSEVIRAKGIIIEDNEGKERILIGAPIPFAKNRIRNNTEKVTEQWGRFFPDNYLEYYENYNHDTFGMLILDDTGHDRIAIGSVVPDPNIGPRIGTASGITINDKLGFERTGYALINIEDKNRVVLGLDNPNGKEGVSLALYEDGAAGLMIGGEEQSIFLGKVHASYNYDGKKDFNGLKIQQEKGKEIILNSTQ